MEFRSLSLLEAERENLIQTYCAIAGTMPQTRITALPEVVISVGPFAHPLCNFAVIKERSGAGAAVQASEGRPHFSIYSFADPVEPGDLKERLLSSGYQVVQTLSMMRWEGSSDRPALQSAQNPRERLSIARFMTMQFFSSLRSEVRERIAEANARSVGAEFYSFCDQHKDNLVGAAMLFETEAAVGLYNVCVAGALRGRGWGSSIVTRLRDEAGSRGKPLVLQCDPALTSWYGRLGLEYSGSLNVWSPSGR